MRLSVDASDLLKWARYIDDIPRYTKPALAKALNTFGEGMVHETIHQLADKYGWDEDSIRQRLVVQEADEHHLEFSMDASQIVRPQQNWSRPWQSRDESDTYDQDTLMNIVVFDEHCCEVCSEAAAEGPYTMSQIMELQAKWAGYEPPTPNILPGPITNLIHPRCRCSAQPWSSYRRLPVSFPSTGQATGGAPTKLMTMKGLARAVKDELTTTLRIKGRGY